MDISRALKFCRMHKGMSKTKLADISGFSVSYLSLLEQGDRNPKISTIEKLCTSLGIPVSIFIFLASDVDELDGISKGLAEKISLIAFQIIGKK